jgi:hypothetical protein
MDSAKIKPKFSGDRALLALQRQLVLDPDRIPEPPPERVPVIGALLLRLGSVAAMAAFAAWGLVSYSAAISTDNFAPAIANHFVNVVAVQPMQLRPSLSEPVGRPTTADKTRPAAVAIANAEAGTSVPVSAMAPTATAPIALAPAPSQHADDREPSRLANEEIAILVKRGNDLLTDGDIAAARLLLRRAAEAGSAEAALALGTTFDPVALQRLGAIGASPDLAKARDWYRRAAELGSASASQQLADLAGVR